MESSWLNLNGRTFTISELSEIDAEIGTTGFEKTTLAFCKLWLTGEKTFTLTTSGSTGTPKEIQISRVQMEASARLTIEALDLKQGMNSLICLDTKYIAGKMMLVRSLINEMNMIAVEPDANPLKGLNHRIDFAAFVPYQVEHILLQSKDKLNAIRCAIIGGAPVSVGLQESMNSTSCSLYATYGMTETISHIALRRLNGEDTTDFFRTQPGVTISLDHRGCLCIQAGYLGSDPIITNDLVDILSPSTFRWLGRIDNVINSGGVKIMPEKVEKALEKVFFDHGMTSRFFVTGINHHKLGKEVALIVESAPWPEELQQSMLARALKLLTKYELPRKILFTEKFVETGSSKINRGETLKLLSGK